MWDLHMTVGTKLHQDPKIDNEKRSYKIPIPERGKTYMCILTK